MPEPHVLTDPVGVKLSPLVLARHDSPQNSEGLSEVLLFLTDSSIFAASTPWRKPGTEFEKLVVFMWSNVSCLVIPTVCGCWTLSSSLRGFKVERLALWHTFVCVEREPRLPVHFLPELVFLKFYIQQQWSFKKLMSWSCVSLQGFLFKELLHIKGARNQLWRWSQLILLRLSEVPLGHVVMRTIKSQ